MSVTFISKPPLTCNCHPVQRDLHSREKRNLFFRKRPKKVGNFTLRLKSIDSQTRAENELKAAEQSVMHIETLVNKRESRDEVIGAVIAVTDGIIAVVDEIAEVNQIFFLGQISLYLILVRSTPYSM